MLPADLAPSIQQPAANAAAVLEGLAQVGLLQRQGRSYLLLAGSRPQSQGPTDLLAVVVNYVQAHGQVTRQDVVGLAQVSEKQAEYLLKRLVQAGRLRLVGRGRNAHYVLSERQNI